MFSKRAVPEIENLLLIIVEKIELYVKRNFEVAKEYDEFLIESDRSDFLREFSL